MPNQNHPRGTGKVCLDTRASANLIRPGLVPMDIEVLYFATKVELGHQLALIGKVILQWTLDAAIGSNDFLVLFGLNEQVTLGHPWLKEQDAIVANAASILAFTCARPFISEVRPSHLSRPPTEYQGRAKEFETASVFDNSRPNTTILLGRNRSSANRFPRC